MDSGSSIHVVNEDQRGDLKNFQIVSNDFALCGGGRVPIVGWGEWHLQLPSRPAQTSRGGQQRVEKPIIQTLVLRKVAYCPDFPTSIVSLQCLEELSVKWLHSEGVIKLESEIIGRTRKMYGQYVIDTVKN